MTWPSSTLTKDEGLILLNRITNSIKSSLPGKIQKMIEGDVTASSIIYLLNEIKTAVSVFDKVRVITGIADYARAQYSDETLDPVADFNNMRTLTQAAGVWIINALPKDGAGYLSIQHMDTEGNITERMFTPAMTADLRVLLNNLLTSIS